MNPFLPDLILYEKGQLQSEIHSYHHRAKWHNYRSRCIYMLTFLKNDGIPQFSIIEGKTSEMKVTAKSIPTRLGHHINRVIKELPNKFPNLQTLQYALMPDHLHLMIYVTEDVEYHLDDVAGVFADECDRRYSSILRDEFNFSFNGAIFKIGYHDRILTGSNQLQTLYDYIRDNPRRLYLKQNFPHYFTNAMLCMSSDVRFGIYGNICLLEHPDKVVVRFSRKFSPELLEAKKLMWTKAIHNGGVLVSPFIHPVEKEYLNLALQSGGKAIIICDNGFHERWKPSKRFIESTAQGKLLFVGPEEFSLKQPVLTRDKSMAMNSIAEFISTLTKNSFNISGFPKNHN